METAKTKKANFDTENYVEVSEKVAQFRAKYLEGRIETELVNGLIDNTDVAVFKCYVYKDGSVIPVSTGYACEEKGKGGFVNGSAHFENAETSSVGRGLRHAGFPDFRDEKKYIADQKGKEKFPDHLKNYTFVTIRLLRFYEQFPEGRIITDFRRSENMLYCRAEVYRNADEDRPAAVGHAHSLSVDIEDTETSAVGRALALLGIETKEGMASFEEVSRVQAQADEQMPPEPVATVGKKPDALATNKEIAQLFREVPVDAVQMFLSKLGKTKNELTKTEVKKIIERYHAFQRAQEEKVNAKGNS